jgi:N-acetyl-beta-hexosaminidase
MSISPLSRIPFSPPFGQVRQLNQKELDSVKQQVRSQSYTLMPTIFHNNVDLMTTSNTYERTQPSRNEAEYLADNAATFEIQRTQNKLHPNRHNVLFELTPDHPVFKTEAKQKQIVAESLQPLGSHSYPGIQSPVGFINNNTMIHTWPHGTLESIDTLRPQRREREQGLPKNG